MCGGEGGGEGDGEGIGTLVVRISRVGDVEPVSIVVVVTPDAGGLGGGEFDVPSPIDRSISAPDGASRRLSCCLVSFSTSLASSGKQERSLKQGRTSRESDRRSKLEQTRWVAQWGAKSVT